MRSVTVLSERGPSEFLYRNYLYNRPKQSVSRVYEKNSKNPPPPSAETALRPRGAFFSADHEPGRRGGGGGGGPGRRVVAVGVGRRDVGVAARQRRRADAVVDAQRRLVRVRLRGRPGRVVEHGRRRVVCGVVHGRVRPAGVAVRRRPAGRGRTRVAEVVPPRGRRRRRRRWRGLVDRLGRRAAVARRTPGGDAGGRAHGQAAGPGWRRRHAVAAVPAPQPPATGRPVRVRGVLAKVRQRGAAVAARPPGPRPPRPPVPGLPAGGLRQTLLVGPAPGRALGPPPGDGLAGPGRRAAAANVRAVRLAGRERHVAVPARARGAQDGRAVHVRRVRADVRRRRVAGPARPAQPRVRVPRAPAAAPVRRVRPSQPRRTAAAEAPVAPLNAGGRGPRIV